MKNRVEQAKPEWIPAIVLYREIQEQGYNGKLTQLRRFLAPLKPMRPEEPLVRFETPAGKQMQVDFTIIYPTQSLGRFIRLFACVIRSFL